MSIIAIAYVDAALYSTQGTRGCTRQSSSHVVVVGGVVQDGQQSERAEGRGRVRREAEGPSPSAERRRGGWQARVASSRIPMCGGRCPPPGSAAQGSTYGVSNRVRGFVSSTRKLRTVTLQPQDPQAPHPPTQESLPCNAAKCNAM